MTGSTNRREVPVWLGLRHYMVAVSGSGGSMTEVRDNVVPHARVRSLREAIRKVRMAEIERTDVVVDLQESERARLEMLSEELQDVFREVPEDDDQFSFHIVGGSQPRLWIDMTSHVLMARDKQTYRFVKDTRMGRVVLLESANLDDMADCITEYIAERIIEKDLFLEGDWLMRRLRGKDPDKVRAMEALAQHKKEQGGPAASFWKGMFLFVLGLLVGAAALVAYAWFIVPGGV